MRPIGFQQILFLGVAILVIAAASTFLINSWREDSAKQSGKNPQTKSDGKGDRDPTKGSEQPSEKPREDPAIQEERRAVSKARLQAILALKSETAGTLTALENEVIAWETRIPPLLKSEDGKQIAANPARLDQFVAVIEKDRVSKARVKDLRDRLDTLTAPIERANLDPSSAYMPSDAILNDIQHVAAEARTKLRDMKEIKAVLDSLQADAAFTQPGEKTLEKIITETNAERARKRAELLAKTRADEHDLESKRLAAAEAKAEQDLANARLALLKAKTDAEKQGIDLQTQDTKRRTDDAVEAERKRVEKAKREAKFEKEYPGVKGFLLPITSPGYKQFKGDNLADTAVKGPMSLSALQGYLGKDPERTQYFARQLSSYRNDRPVGSFPIYSTGASSTANQFEAWYRVQDFLAEFGDIMVERGLLAP